jgi:hypothetical protein
LGDTSVNGRILKKQVVKMLTGFCPVTKSFEDGNKPLAFIKFRKFLDRLIDYQLLKGASASWD